MATVAASVSGPAALRGWLLDFGLSAWRRASRREFIVGMPDCCPRRRHELIDARGGPEVDEFGEHVGQVGLRIDIVKLAALDQRGDAGPVCGTLVTAGEERVLRLSTIGLMLRSTMLVSSSTRPSLRKRVSPSL